MKRNEVSYGPMEGMSKGQLLAAYQRLWNMYAEANNRLVRAQDAWEKLRKALEDTP